MGGSWPGGGNVIVRLSANGKLDSSFGENGIVEPPHWFAAMTLQPDGKIVAVGTKDEAAAETLVLMRYTSSGAPDVGFGSAPAW